MRGNGDSQGLMADEYSAQELSDACEVIDWIVAQPWSNGSVGMMGISWGGFNALQVAAMRPAPLKAIITLCSTVDRYADDTHYKDAGRCLQERGSAAGGEPVVAGEGYRRAMGPQISAFGGARTPNSAF